MRTILTTSIKAIALLFAIHFYGNIMAQKKHVYKANDKQHIFTADKYPVVSGDSIYNHSSLKYLGLGGREEEKERFSYDDFKKYIIVEESGKRVQVLETSDVVNISDDGSKKVISIPEGKDIQKGSETNLNLTFGNVDVTIEGNLINSYFKKANIYSFYRLAETEYSLEVLFGAMVKGMLHSLDHNKGDKVEHTNYKNVIQYNAYVSIFEELTGRGYKYKTELAVTLNDNYGTELLKETQYFDVSSINELFYEYNNRIIDLLESESLQNAKSKLDETLKNNHDSLSLVQIQPVEKMTNSLENANQSVVTIFTEFGHGSGCIISKDGYVLTNHHVVINADSMTVVTNKGDSIPFHTVQSDPLHDLALIKADSAEFEQYFGLGSKNPIQPVNSDIYIIGTPAHEMLNNTLSKGYIAGYRKEINDGLYQIGVSVNPGNSGGAMTDANGNLIGIVNAKMIGYGVKKIGYAVPIEHVFNALNIELTH